MSGNEANLVQRMRLRAGKLKKVLLRNNIGAYQDKTGRWVTYGLGIGTSDLIGWSCVTVTPEMVGRTLAIFTAYEAKTEEGMKPSGKKQKEHFDDQMRFINAVVAAGGIARMVTHEDQI